jgi:hypothetical protein
MKLQKQSVFNHNRASVMSIHYLFTKVHYQNGAHFAQQAQRDGG